MIKMNIQGKFGWRVLLLAGILVGTSCNKEDDIEYFVDSSLTEYFDRFAGEAAERGVVVDYVADPVNGYIRVITSQGVIGQCAHKEDEPNTVIIDKFYWDSASELEREFLVFHELGHCVLDREHLDNSDGQGFCVSIMTSGTGFCTIRYTAANRESMLDELFHP